MEYPTQQPVDSAPCPCGSGQDFPSCCKPLLDGYFPAPTAQALMRSRYTAYVLGCSDYILKTWAKETRPKAMDLTSDQPRWLGLEIHNVKDGMLHDLAGEVDFTASYIAAGNLCTMHENSRFIRSEQIWYYLDGTCELSRKKIERNDACPCKSGKKFKRCCGV